MPTPSRTSAPEAHRERRRLRVVGPIVAIVLLLVLLGYGVLSAGGSDAIDEKLAQRQPAEAPGFRLDVIDQGGLRLA